MLMIMLWGSSGDIGEKWGFVVIRLFNRGHNLLFCDHNGHRFVDCGHKIVVIYLHAQIRLPLCMDCVGVEP